jgi:hypothetical protein
MQPHRRTAVDHKQQSPTTTAPLVACAAHNPHRPVKLTRRPPSTKARTTTSPPVTSTP